ERSEAVKAILYLYRTFSTDFRDIWAQVIAPQMYAMEDEAWQVRAYLNISRVLYTEINIILHSNKSKVRAQLAATLATYQISHPDIILALIIRLADSQEEVRTCALSSLVELGVDSRRALASWMSKLGLIREDAKPVHKTALDVGCRH
ncbi:hypothetical protein HDU93_008689, partial [Gonapodya sp. JEL0774]